MKAQQVIMLRAIINESYPYVKMDKEEGDEIWFLMLQDYNYELMQKSLLDYIKDGNKFAPSIADLIKLHDHKKSTFRHPVVEFMLDKGYFNDRDGEGKTIYSDLASWNRDNRVKKHNMWVLEGRLPDIFKEDFEKYKEMMHQDELQWTERKMLNETSNN